MLRQIGWELKKLAARKAQWAVLAVGIVFAVFYILTCAQVPTQENSSVRDDRLPETLTLYDTLQGMTVEEFSAQMGELAPSMKRDETGRFTLEPPNPERELSLEEQIEWNNAFYSTPEFPTMQVLMNDLNHLLSMQEEREQRIEKNRQELKTLRSDGKADTFEARRLQKEIEELSTLPQPRIYRNADHSLSPLYGLTGTNFGSTPLLAIITSFLIVFVVAGLYPQEYRGDMDNLLLTTKQGQRVPAAKLWTAVIASAFLCVFIQGVYFAVYSCYYRVDWSLPVSSIVGTKHAAFDVTSGTVGQVFLMLFGMYLLGGVVLGLFTLWLSSLSSYSVFALGGGILLLLLPYGMWNLSDGVMDWIKALLLPSLQSPAELNLWFTKYLNVLGYPIPAPAIMTAVGLLALLLLLFLPTRTFLHRAGNRKQKEKGDKRNAQTGAVGAA